MQWALGQGLACSSHYSGYAGDLMGLPWCQEYLEATGFLTMPDDVGFVYSDSCDILPRAQHCLTRNQPPFTHVMGDMLDRLPPDLRQELEGLCPKKSGDPQYDEDCFWEMYSRLDNACATTDLFKDGSVAPCVLHGNIGDCHKDSKDWQDSICFSMFCFDVVGGSRFHFSFVFACQKNKRND